jgi:outer membrane protein TolC
VNAQKAELEQTRQLLASSVARLYWEWQTESAINMVLSDIRQEQNSIISRIKSCISAGSRHPSKGWRQILTPAKPMSSLPT